jgi:hypothetical protein
MNKYSFNPLEYPLCLAFPSWLEGTSWAEHIPFGMFSINALRPKVFVELGTFYGVSYCAFCQAVKATKIETKCYAVDTWQGDKHAGALESNALTKLRAHHDPLYSGFSHLIQSTFDGALSQFAEKSIDLLHIDGLHTYEAVKHDFETWLPKMSDRGVILFHDTNVRERDFGVWQLWSEIKEGRPHFEFLHGYGLGVLAVGNEVPSELKFLFNAKQDEVELIRELFYSLGLRIEVARNKERMKQLESYEQVVMGQRPMRMFYLIKEKGIKDYLKFHITRLKEKNK